LLKLEMKARISERFISTIGRPACRNQTFQRVVDVQRDGLRRSGEATCLVNRSFSNTVLGEHWRFRTVVPGGAACRAW